MIQKDKDFKNKYILQDDSTTTDLRVIAQGYHKLRCIICNNNTSKRFKQTYIFSLPITINNEIPDDVFFINGKY